MGRLLLAFALAAAAVLVAAVLRRRSSPSPIQAGWQAPVQLDRADFARPDAPYLVALFSSDTCQSCSAMAGKVAVLACADVAVDDVEYSARRELHEKYRVEAVPMIVVADAAGVVRAHFTGPATATDVWAAVAEVREPGTSPEPELGGG